MVGRGRRRGSDGGRARRGLRKGGIARDGIVLRAVPRFKPRFFLIAVNRPDT